MQISQDFSNVKKVYIEPTTFCNLSCKTCMRNVWNTQQGRMTHSTFQNIEKSILAIDPLPSVFLGGYGEPLSHPNILEMVTSLKTNGIKVELITNGVLLDSYISQALVDLKVDRVWVSVDAADSKSYQDIRQKSELPLVLNNVRSLQALRLKTAHRLPRLGISFVAMKSNIEDFPEIVKIGRMFGVDHFSVSHVLAHTVDLSKEILYGNLLKENLEPSQYAPKISFPRIPFSDESEKYMVQKTSSFFSYSICDQDIRFGENYCPFVNRSSIAIRWDGKVSPCLPLLHNHQYYLEDQVHYSFEHFVGDINSDTILSVWNKLSYQSFRQKLLNFDFSPCAYCNSCEMAFNNLEDCFGSGFPSCGKCLWAQGLIRCP